MGSSVAFESSLERDFLVLLDFDPVVVGVKEQPVALEYRDSGGRDRYYTPDFLVEYSSGARVLYEVKYRENLWEEWPKLKPKFKAARRYARTQAMRFEIITEVEIRGGGFLGNAKFLRAYRDQQGNPGIEEHLVSTLAVIGETTPKTLLAACYATQENQMRAIPSMWRLLAIGRVHSDLCQPLTMNSPIWVTIGEGFLWQDPHSYPSNLDR